MSLDQNLSKILIVDFGSQFTQLIARRIREIGVFSEIISHKKVKIKDIDQTVKGIILSGGPLNVYQINKYSFDKKILQLNIPVLGICFGHQIISEALGGNVTHNDKGWELGSYKIEINKTGLLSKLFDGIDKNDYFYFSHQDIVSKLPKNAIELAENNMGIQSFSINNIIFGVQFHPEFNVKIMDQYVKIRYKKGIISNYNPVLESKSSFKIISNFIEIIKGRM